MSMHRSVFWFLFGVIITFGCVLMVFGVLFIRDAFISAGETGGEVMILSLLFGIILLLVGGGLLSSCIAESIRKMWRP